MSHHILIVEDDPTLQAALKRYLKRQGHEVQAVDRADEALDSLSSGFFGLILCDVTLPDGHCFQILDEVARQGTPSGVVVMTADENIDHPIAAMQRGAADFLIKPFSFEALDRALDRADSRMRGSSIFKTLPDTSSVADWREKYAPEIIGNDKALGKVFSMIECTADTDCSVLVTGESGTGKELIARAVHRASDRAEGPFVTVNCAAIPENLLESELFGHVRGAFTGATTSREGRFAAAHGGTIFLNEIGEMPQVLQSKLLRVLQEKEVTPVGETKPRKVDVRVVAATNRDLDEMVEEGTFREDLLYRLEVIPVHLPPLRERPRDIPQLVQFFIQKYNHLRNRRIDGLTDEAMEVLTAYDWPGNVRQLQNAIERMVVLKAKGRIDVDDLPRRIRKNASVATQSDSAPTLPDEGVDLRDAVEKFENALILQALERTGWNKNQAASILKMNRTTLVEKLKKKNISKPKVAAAS